MSQLRAVIFDLDGVITDTAEFHYLAWQRLADEEGLTFNRQINEQLRGVSRRDSLLIILDGQPVAEEKLQEWMARKNNYYVAMLDQITPEHLLPGVLNLLERLDAAGIPYAVASASKNAPLVCQRLGITPRLAVLADGRSVPRQKPHPDLFRFAAAKMNVPAAQALVVEDAAAGVEAALRGGLAALALGPVERFDGLPVKGRLAHRDNLEAVTLAELEKAVRFDPCWNVVQDEFSPGAQQHMETVFTIGNGYFASRGSFEEGYPGNMPATFAHGIYDDMPVSFTTLANMPNWLDLAVTIDGHAFRLDQGEILHFQRALDLQAGILHRDVSWRSPLGQVLDLHFERFISYTEEHVGGLRVLITAVSDPCTVSLFAGINGHVSNKDLLHWQLEEQGHSAEDRIWLHSRTRHSGIDLGTAVSFKSSAQQQPAYQNCQGQPRLSLNQALLPGQTLQVDKLVAYAASRDAVEHAGDVIGRAHQALAGRTYEALQAAHTSAWQALWQESDVIIEGDDEAQLAVRFNLFQLLIAAPQQDDRASIGAKTLSGFGYAGHVFWDTEIFILPFLIYTHPHLARNMLMYRYHALPGARRKAARNGFLGAQYPWESAATGDEVTPSWVPDFRDPQKLVRIWTGDIQIHISADVAYAAIQYWKATGDDAFMRDYGAEIILDTARFWGSRAEAEHQDGLRRYAIRDVIGPDEYHEHVDNNSFTNYMARWHLQTAISILDWLEKDAPATYERLRRDLQIGDELLQHWLDVIKHLIFLYDEESGLIEQFEGFMNLETVAPEFIAAATKSLQVILGIEGANQRQVLKQADVIMLLCLFRDQFDKRTWQKNWDTYMPLTDHVYGSSLGPSMHAWAACEMNKADEAYEHFMLAARADLRNPRGNAGDGIHAASTGGVWQALVFGFAGFRQAEDGYTLQPRLPAHWRRLAFTVRIGGEVQRVNIVQQEGA